MTELGSVSLFLTTRDNSTNRNRRKEMQTWVTGGLFFALNDDFEARYLQKLS